MKCRQLPSKSCRSSQPRFVARASSFCSADRASASDVSFRGAVITIGIVQSCCSPFKYMSSYFSRAGSNAPPSLDVGQDVSWLGDWIAFDSKFEVSGGEWEATCSMIMLASLSDMNASEKITSYWKHEPLRRRCNLRDHTWGKARTSSCTLNTFWLANAIIGNDNMTGNTRCIVPYGSVLPRCSMQLFFHLSSWKIAFGIWVSPFRITGGELLSRSYGNNVIQYFQSSQYQVQDYF